MPTTRRIGLFLVLLACCPLIMAAGGGPAHPRCALIGRTFEDVAGEPRLPGGQFCLFDSVGALRYCDDESRMFGLTCGETFTFCQVLKAGWVQTFPLPSVDPQIVSCAGLVGGPGPLGPVGYQVDAGQRIEQKDFGNFRGDLGSLRGTKFNDLNGNGVRDPGEPGLPDWKIHLVGDSSSPQPKPGPPVHATITVDRHRRGDCPECTTTGGRVSVVLTRGNLSAGKVFDVRNRFRLGCVPGITREEELKGREMPTGDYIPISDYWLPPDALASVFAKIGVAIDPPAYVPVITEVTERDCVTDPNNQGVTNPGILVVEAEIGFVSKEVESGVIASTTTNASGKYAFMLPPGTYTVCEELQPGWRQTFPVPGKGRVSCGESNVQLGPHGHVATLRDPGQVAGGRDFGNAAFKSGLTALNDAQLWLGLKSSDEGTQFDVKVELLQNGSPVASGLRRCVTGLTLKPTLARGIHVAWNAFNPVPLAPTDALALRVSTRIGTNSDDTKCGPRASRSSARGLRLYYDAANRPSHFDATLTADTVQSRYLDSDGTVCPAKGPESAHVTDPTLTSTAPSAPKAKCKDSSDITFSGGNLFKEVGTWRLP